MYGCGKQHRRRGALDRIRKFMGGIVYFEISSIAALAKLVVTFRDAATA